MVDKNIFSQIIGVAIDSHPVLFFANLLEYYYESR